MPLQLFPECVKNWRLEELDQLLNDFYNFIAEAIDKANIEYSVSYTNIVLSTAGKSMLTMREVLFLAAAGYPDGALSLSRNLYEQFIILAFFEQQNQREDFSLLVEDYFTDYEIKNYKEHIFACESIGKKEELPILRTKLEESKKAAHRKVNGDYWWTGEQNFTKLVEFVQSSKDDDNTRRFMRFLHAAYKRACISLHASCLGNILRLKDNAEPYIIDIFPTIERQYFPLWFATSSLIYIAGITCKTLGISHDPFVSKMNEFALFYKTSYDRSINQ